MIPYLLSDVALEKTRAFIQMKRLLFAHCKQTNKKNKQNKYDKTTCKYLHHCYTYRTPLSYDSISAEKREVRP